MKSMPHPSHIVAIGASAGGLDALRQFFSVPLSGTSLAFVVIQHISPNFKSLMPELLAKVTDIPVVTIEEHQELAAGRIYLIPPGFKVRLDGWRFVTEPLDPLRRVLNLPINIFFRSAAENHKASVIGVILSGTGSDGALGLQQIHEVGGLTFVQTPVSAQFDGMPRAALDALRADFILNPAEMIPEILHFAEGLEVPSVGAENESLRSADEDTFAQIFRILNARVGIDYSKYKIPTLARRIEKRMKRRQVASLVEYADLLTVNPEECQDLAKDFLINVTQFFRDTEAFETLYQRVLLPMVKQLSPGDSLRFWVPACSSGEEAYTLAMLLLEAEAELKTRVQFKIFATDVDAESLQVASRGVYPAGLVTTIPERFLSKYFTHREDCYVVSPMLRERILFAPQDLIHSPPFRKINLVSCRNALIYFQQDLQVEILRKFHYSLVPDGILFLGSSESVSEARGEFEPVVPQAKIFKKIGATTARGHWNLNFNPEFQVPLPPSVYPSASLPLGRSSGGLQTPSFGASLLSAMLSPGVVINSSNKIVHFVGELSPYFGHPAGEANFDALRMIRPPFKAALRNALFRLFSDEREGEGEVDVEFETSCETSGEAHSEHQDQSFTNEHGENGARSGGLHKGQRIRLVGRRFADQTTSERLVFIRFVDAARSSTPVSVVAPDQHSHHLILELDRELEHTRDRLQNSIEALEITNEELHSTNEELLSANEELQSTNEELQSVNEELHTVNSEHQMKIEELIELNSDLDNLLAHTGIGVLFLDENLNVRKYTQAAKKYVHVMERDVGRSIRHLAVRMTYPAFVTDLEAALRDGQPSESTITSSRSDGVLVRIVPYRSSSGPVQGVTVIFINVEYQSEVVEQIMRQQIESLCSLFQVMSEPAFLLDEEGRYVYANPIMETLAERSLAGCQDADWLDAATCSLFKAQEAAARQDLCGRADRITLSRGGESLDYRRVLFPLADAMFSHSKRAESGARIERGSWDKQWRAWIMGMLLDVKTSQVPVSVFEALKQSSPWSPAAEEVHSSSSLEPLRPTMVTQSSESSALSMASLSFSEG